MIPASGFLLVYATRLNVTEPNLDENGRLHTNFVLNVNGEYLGITDPDGNTIFDLEGGFPEQFADVSYGFTAEGELKYLLSSTPGELNSDAYLGLVFRYEFQCRSRLLR